MIHDDSFTCEIMLFTRSAKSLSMKWRDDINTGGCINTKMGRDKLKNIKTMAIPLYYMFKVVPASRNSRFRHKATERTSSISYPSSRISTEMGCIIVCKNRIRDTQRHNQTYLTVSRIPKLSRAVLVTSPRSSLIVSRVLVLLSISIKFASVSAWRKSRRYSLYGRDRKPILAWRTGRSSIQHWSAKRNASVVLCHRQRRSFFVNPQQN